LTTPLPAIFGTASAEASDVGGSVTHYTKKGDAFVLNVERPHTHYRTFIILDKIKLGRPDESYIHLESGMHGCLRRSITFIGLVERLMTLRGRSDLYGHLKAYGREGWYGDDVLEKWG
jgi:hypothetical protein